MMSEMQENLKGIDPLRQQLLGCMIGLARTCSNNVPTEETEGLLLAGLMAMGERGIMNEAQVLRLIQRVKADKARVSPNCVSCTHRCGKNDDYDVRRLLTAPDAVRRAKLTILRQLQARAARGVVDQLTFDSLFALAEDWEADAFAWYVEETAKNM